MTEDKQKERLEKAEQKAKLCTFLFMGFIAFCLLLAAYSHTEDMEKAQKITGTVSNKYMVLSNSLLQKNQYIIQVDDYKFYLSEAEYTQYDIGDKVTYRLSNDTGAVELEEHIIEG